MAMYEERLTALEKDAVMMKHDIVYKLDDTNSAVTIIKGVAGTLAQDVKVIRSQMKTMDIRLDGIDTHLTRLEEQQNEQAQGIKDVKRHLDTLEEKFDQRFISLEGTLEQILRQLTSLTKKPE
jgi:chromosome segregation ATPase